MSRVDQTGDAQSMAFGLAGGVNNAFSQSALKTASASSATTVTTSGLAAHDSQGCMIIGNSAADWSGTALYGVCQDNTTTVVTVDRWYTMAGAASGSSPSTTGPFLIVPAPPPFWFAALSDSTSAVAHTDKGSAIGGTEAVGSGLDRQKVTTVTRTAGSSIGSPDIGYTITLATTWTYTGSTSKTIGRAMLTNSLVASKDFAYFIDQINSGTPATVSANGDTFTGTWSVTVG